MRAIALAAALVAAVAGAGEPWQRHVDKTRFKQIAVRLAPRVDLFQAIWEADGTAQIYGGTARDYFWWLRRELAKCKTAACVDDFVRRTEDGVVDAREFLLGDADVDVLGTEAAKLTSFDRAHFTRIDVADRRRFDAAEKLSADERKQGALPTEKLRLGKDGLGESDGFAGGAGEIYDASPTLMLTQAIRETDGFRQYENHPLLLALRWVRQAGVAYAHRFGTNRVDDVQLAQTTDPDSLEKATEVAAALDAAPEELEPFLANPRFLHRLNRARARLFQGFTNAEAARHLYEIVGLDHALLPFADRLDPFFTVTFRKDWSASTIEAHRTRLGDARAALGTLGAYFAKSAMPVVDGAVPAAGEVHLFHGTWTAATYRNIATHGILPSEQGLAGMGVYAVDPRSAVYAKQWREPAGNGYALRLCVKADATFLDLTSGEGKRLLEAFRALRAELGPPWSDGYEEDALANYLGVDVLKYPYNEASAYVVKNGAAVLRTEPWSHRLRSLAELRQAARETTDPIAVLREAMADDASVLTHLDYLLAELPLEKRIETHLDLTPIDGFDNAATTVETLNRYRRKHRDVLPKATWARYYARIPVKKMLAATPEERAMRAVAAIADAWEFFPLASLVEEAHLLAPTHLGGCIERVLRERRGWMQKFLQTGRRRTSLMEDLMIFQRRPLLYVELLEFIERERPDLFDDAAWKAAWGLVDFDGPFLRMYLHVPKTRTHGPLLAPTRLKDVLRAAFRVAHKAPQILDQLRRRIRDLDESRLWATIDETLVEVEAWAPEHSAFLARIAATLPETAKSWELFARHALELPDGAKLRGLEADTSAARLVLEATKGRFGSLSETVATLQRAAGAFEDGRERFRELALQVVRRAAESEKIEGAWRGALERATVLAAALGDLPSEVAASEGFAHWLEGFTDHLVPDGTLTPSTVAKLRKWAKASCASAIATAG